ncbi:hypothetical protein [Neisseria sp.]
METKKCNKCGKVKPLNEMTRRRDEETGEFKYLTLCKSCKAEYNNRYMQVNQEEFNRKQRERRAKKKGIKQEPHTPVTRVCRCCKQEKPIDSFYQKYPNRDGSLVYEWTCKACRKEAGIEAYRAKHGRKRVIKRTKPSVWDLICMPKGLSVEETVNLANEVFQLLSNECWKAGEAQKIYKQFGMKWSYL